MNKYTVYQSARGGGKTSWIVKQIAELLSITAGGPLNVAVIVPAKSHVPESIARNLPVPVYTEKTFQNVRGRQFDYIYVDNADLFLDNPLELCAEYAPGTHVTFTYTPFAGSSLPKAAPPPEPEPEPEPIISERELMIVYMLAYIDGTI